MGEAGRFIRRFLAASFSFALALGLLETSGAKAQTTLRVDVGLVTVGVHVTDRHGKEIRGLTAADFKLYENDQPYKISFFSSEELPISLVILLDHSSSMGQSQKLEHAKNAALSLVRASHPKTQFLYIPFDNRIPLVSPFTEDRGRIENQIQQTPLGHGTSLYDAILVALDRCARAPLPRQTLVVISDGADESSVHQLYQVIQQIRNSQVQVFAIGYFDPGEAWIFRRGQASLRLQSGEFVDNPLFVLQELAKESGGASFFPDSDKGLSRAVDTISNDLREQYTLAFYPPDDARPGVYRRIRVEVDRPHVTVRARPGYAVASTN